MIETATIAPSIPRPKAVEPIAVARFAWAATSLVVFLYTVRTLASADPLTEEIWKEYALKETGLLERAELVVWFVATVLFFRLFAKAVRRRERGASLAWLGLLAALSFFALGEEAAWGQNVFGFEPPAWFVVHNEQKDLSLHNLEIAGALGLPRAGLAKRMLNAAPYFVCAALWIGVPLAARSRRFPLLESLALPGQSVVCFFAVSAIWYVAIDLFIADVAEIFELAISFVFALAASDLWAQSNS